MTQILRVFHPLTQYPKHGILSTVLFNLLLLGKEAPNKILHPVTGRFLVKSQRCFGMLTLNPNCSLQQRHRRIYGE